MSTSSELYSWGGDHCGQLCLSGKTQGKTYNVPRFCNIALSVRSVSCGEDHAAIVTTTGEVHTVGSNAEGRLGVGDRTLRGSSSPMRVETLLGCRVTNLACGWTHTSALTDTGDLYSWGSGEHGALGTGSCESQWLPALVRVGRDFTPQSVSCGARHSLVVGESRNGAMEVWSCGSGEAGQLGTGRREKEVNFVKIAAPESIKQVACGVFHTGLVGQSGRVYTMGGNSFGQLGLGHKKSCSVPQRLTALDAYSIVKIACGNHSAAVSDRGQLFLWGSGPFGEFLTPQVVGELPAKVKDVQVGGSFGAALDASGNVWTWGSNTNGELGLGDYDSRPSPTLVPFLQGKSVNLIACGGSFCIAVGDSRTAQLEYRSISRVTNRPASRAVHSRSITSMGFEQSRSPLPARDEVRTPDLPEKNSLRGYYSEVRSEVRKLRDSIAPDSRKSRDLECRLEQVQRRVSVETSRAQRLEERSEEQRKLYQDDVARLQRELQARRTDVEAASQFAEQVSKEKRELEVQLQTVQERESDLRERVSAEVEMLRAEVGEKDREAKEMVAAHEELIQERDRLLEELTEREETLHTLESQVQEMHRDRDSAFQELQDLQVDFRRETQLLQHSLETAKREAEDLRYHVTRLEEEKRELEETGSRLTKAVKTAKDQTRELTTTNQSLLAELQTLRSEAEKRQSEVAALTQELELVVRERKQDQGSINQLQLLIVEREGECETAAREREAFEAEIKELRENVLLAEEKASEFEQENNELRATVEGCEGQIEVMKRDTEEQRTRYKRLEDSFVQVKDRLQSETMRKDEERTRACDTYERKIAAVSRELSDLKAVKAKLESDHSQELTSYRRSDEELRAELKRKKEEMIRFEEIHSESVEGYERKVAELTERLMAEEAEKRTAESDLDVAMGTVRRLEELLQSQQKTAENDLKSLQSSMHIIEARYEAQLENFGRLLTEEKEKRQSAESANSRLTSETRRLEDSCDSQLRKLDSASKELDKFRSLLLEKDSEIRSLQDTAKLQERKLSMEVESKGKELKIAVEKVEMMVESQHQMQMAIDRLTDEKMRLQKQAFDSASAAEKHKRTVEDVNDRLQAANRKLDELKSQNLELEGKNRDLFLRAERDPSSRTREYRTPVQPSPIRLSYTDLSTQLRPLSPESKVGMTPDRGTSVGGKVDTSPIRPQTKPYRDYMSPIVSTDSGIADPRGKASSYNDKKAEFESHLLDLQKRMEESSRVS